MNPVPAPVSAASTSTDVRVLALPDPAAWHPISLVHRAPEPSAPSARAFLALLLERMPVAGGNGSR
jgi:DNA-binding transcriptional LysR family regulator